MPTKIKSIKSIGKKRTYSPQMSSCHHCYAISNNDTSPIQENSHAVSYAIQCYRCLYLKTHYPAEWWSCVLNTCNAKKQPNYIRIAKSEGTEFGSLEINNLSIEFNSVDGKIVPGLLGIKGIGKKMVDAIDTSINDIKDIDDFVGRQINNKIFLERVINLGAFDKIHENRKALWYWYQYKYGTNEEAKEIRRIVGEKIKYTPEQIEEIREKLYLEHKKKHPKSTKIPKRIREHNPKIIPSRQDVMGLIKEDYKYEEKLEFQHEFLNYHWDSPMDLYWYKGDFTIKNAMDSDKTSILECVISSAEIRRTNNGNKFITLSVTDGIDFARVQIWENVIQECGEDIFKPGVGINIQVKYNQKFKSFNLAYDKVTLLPKAEKYEEFKKYIEDTEVFPPDIGV